MKKAISLLLSTIIALSTLSISFPVIAKEIEQNNAIVIGEKVAALSERYDEDETEITEAKICDISPDIDENAFVEDEAPEKPTQESTNRNIRRSRNRYGTWI